MKIIANHDIAVDGQHRPAGKSFETSEKNANELLAMRLARRHTDDKPAASAPEVPAGPAVETAAAAPAPETTAAAPNAEKAAKAPRAPRKPKAE
jgi:hypothetical protein